MSTPKETPQQKPERVKCIFLGAAGVGKTSIIQSFMYSQFQDGYETTVGIDFFTKEIQIQGKIVNLQIWDTAGQEQFKSLIPGYIKDAKIVVLVYDVSDPKTLNAAHEWYQQVLEIQGTDPITFLVGNKTDLPRKVINKDVEEVAHGKMTRMETSAKNSENISALFKAIGESVANVEPSPTNENEVVLQASPIERPQKEGCSC